MCCSSRSDLKVKNEALEPGGVNQIVFFAWSDTFEEVYPSTNLINGKTCKNSVLRRSWDTMLLCQLFEMSLTDKVYLKSPVG